MNHTQSELESEDVTSYQIRSDYKCSHEAKFLSLQCHLPEPDMNMNQLETSRMHGPDGSGDPPRCAEGNQVHVRLEYQEH